MTKKKLLGVVLAGLGFSVVLGPSAATAAIPRDAAPEPGHWVAYQPQSSAKQELVPPIRRPCPGGTTNYPGDAARYNCLSVYGDNANRGHLVGLRQGTPDPAGFGFLHALQDHNVDEETIGTIIANNAAGIDQGNDRFLYGLRYEVAGRPVVFLELIEDRKPSRAAPDDYSLGTVTSYCRGQPNNECPDWVNDTVP